MSILRCFEINTATHLTRISLFINPMRADHSLQSICTISEAYVYMNYKKIHVNVYIFPEYQKYCICAE